MSALDASNELPPGESKGGQAQTGEKEAESRFGDGPKGTALGEIQTVPRFSPGAVVRVTQDLAVAVVDKTYDGNGRYDGKGDQLLRLLK